MAINVFVETPSDVVPATVAVEAVTATQQMVQAIDDDEVQIVGKTQKLSSSSIMMPTTAVPPASPATEPLHNHKAFFPLFFFIHPILLD